MKSKAIVFTGPLQVEVREQETPAPGPGEVLLETLVSLVSTGTESFCFRGEFEPGTSWAGWVKYPFYPGYSNVGRVIALGEGVTDYQVGDRVCSLLGHVQHGVAGPAAGGWRRSPRASATRPRPGPRCPPSPRPPCAAPSTAWGMPRR
jgi:2-desacetyl-2-hydroxyethyl bacteriochlorophyllide A dehydrogenase